MKAHITILLVLALLLSAGQAGASYWFKVVDIFPSPVVVSPGGSANFTVMVKGLGSERAYVELVFRNKTQGLDISCAKRIQNVYPAGVTEYNCSVHAASDMAPGNYSFVVDVAAKSAPSGKMTGYINVLGPAATDEMAGKASGEEGLPAGAAADGAQAQEETKETPSPGVMAAILGLVLAAGILSAPGKKN